jgi:hypothetical protein
MSRLVSKQIAQQVQSGYVGGHLTHRDDMLPTATGVVVAPEQHVNSGSRPASLTLLGLGLAGIGARRWQRKRT